ncbi:hypothetical protein SAMN05192561_10584 [Halopenitus malekzadehii]|uniref:Uncharacterized protein n=1 Tax=Halopenitus malekzadehii TaxID=1267564 RepID=A0A1H6J455_9EURY|nr:hypothetical protein SAMN05192561_10584 [Halopenitus malekzadehii]
MTIFGLEVVTFTDDLLKLIKYLWFVFTKHIYIISYTSHTLTSY